MDPEQERDQRDEKRSNVDRANDYASKARRAYKKRRKAMAAASWGKKAAAQGIRAIAGATSEILVPVVIVAIIIIVFLLVLLGGSSNLLDDQFGNQPFCGNISASPTQVNASGSATISTTGCPPGVTFAWTPPSIGILSPSNTPVTTYTAPSVVSVKTDVAITVVVCDPIAQGACTNLTTSITVIPDPTGTRLYTCQNRPGQYCSPQNCSGDDEDVGIETCPTARRCCAITPSCATIAQRLLKDFGVKMVSKGETITCALRKKVYDIYSIPGRSTTYMKKLKPSSPFTLEFYSGTSGRASGYVPSAYTIRLTGFGAFMSHSSWYDLGAFLLQHETGHLIKNRNRSEFYVNYPHSTLKSNDPGCYDDGFLKTYSLRSTDPKSESMAEATGLYVYNRKNGVHASISNFRTQCDATYSWIRSHLYGGTTINP